MEDNQKKESCATDQLDTAQLLKQNESLLTEAQQVAHVGSWNWDIQRNTLTWSDELYRIYGFQPQEFIVTYDDFLERVHPEDRDVVVKTVADCLKSHEAFSYEERIIRPDGEVRVLHSHGNLVCDEKGNPTRMFGACQDITDRKKAEDGLRKQKEILQTIFDCIPLMISLVDPDLQFQLVNREWERKLGWSLEELKNSDVDIQSEFYPDPEYLEKAKQFFREPKGEWTEFKTRTRGGQIKDTTWTRIPLSDGSSIGIGNDITESKRAEEARREAEQRYRDIFENAGEGIFQTTPEGQYIAANPALARMHGFDSPEELISSLRDISRQVYVDPARREEFKSLLEEHGVVRGFEHQVIRQDGSEIWVSVNARAVRDTQGAILYYEGTAQDINERKRAEARSAAFATLARKLSGTRTPLDAARIIVQTARDLFGWDSCDLNHYDADRDLVYQMLNIDIIDGRQTEVFGVISGRKPTARGRRIIDHGPELLLREEPAQFDEDAIPYGDRTRPSASIMTVPIRHADRVIGLLSIQSYTPHSYDSAALDNLQALADHCGEALNRIRAEQALVESEERFRQMADQFEDVLWITDRGIRKALYVNPAYEKVFGRSIESVTERVDSFVEVVHPDDRDAVQGMLARQREGAHEALEYRIVQPGGSVRWLLRRSFPIRDNDGEIYRVGGIVQDITERKRAQEELQESEERFRQLSEAAFEAIILHEHGTILEVNQPFCRMYGYERAEVIGKSVLDLTPPEFREPLLQRVRSAGTGSFEGLALRKDGTIFRTEVAAKPIHYQGRVVRVAAIRDISEQRRNERRQAAQYAVTRVLAESATLAEATPRLLQVICETLRWKMGEFWRVCDNKSLLRCVETWHVPKLDATSFIEASRQTELAPGDGLPGRVWQSSQPAWISDVMTDPRFARAPIAAKLGLRGAVAFPILLENQTLGVMLFFSRRAPEVDEDLLKIMSAIGSQIGQFTERKRAEEALLASERKYRDIFAFAPVGIYQSLRDGTLITANKALVEKLGYTSVDELLRVNLGSGIYLSENERERLIGEYEGLGYAGDLDMQWKRKDGSPICVQLSAHAIKGPNGETEYFEGFVRDITEHKRAERERDAISEVIQSVNLTSNLEELLTQVHQSLGRVLYAENCCVVLYDKQTGLLEAPFFVDLVEPNPFPMALSKNCTAKVFSSGQPLLMNEAIFAGLLERGEVELIGRPAPSYLAVPLMTPSETLGVIVVQHYEKDNVYNQRDVEFLSAVAAQLARAIERKRAQESLRESEERYRDLVENSRELICTHDLDGRVLSANRAAAETLGYDSNELLEGKNIRDILAPEVRHEFEQYMASLRERGATSGIMLVETSTGERRMWEYYNSLRTDGVTTPIVRGMARDVTDRKLAEQALLASERKYRDIFTFAPVGIYQSLRDGAIITANHTLAEMLGYASVDELLRAELARDVYLVEGERERLIREHEARGYPIDLELQWKAKDGSPIWVQLTAHAIKGVNGATEYWEGFVRDITERKRSEEALRESEERYRDLVENSRELICTHDLDGVILSANRAASEVLGYDLKDCCGKKNYRDLLVPEVRDQFDDYLARLRRDGFASGLTLVQTSSGERRILEYHNTVRTEGVATPIVRGMARDITEQRRAEKAISDLRHELELTMNSMEEGVHRVDMQGNIAFENPAAARMLGWEVAELLGKPAHLTMHHTRQDGTPYPKEECPIYATLRDGITRQVADEVFWRRDGTSLPVDYMTAPMRNTRNEIDAVVVTFRDITERKRAGESLQLFRNLIDQSNDAIEVLDPVTFRFIDCNQSAYRSLGYTREEFLSLTVFDIDPIATPSSLAELNETITTSGFATFESVHVRKDGTTFPVEVNVKLVRLERVYRLAVVRDISGRMQAAEALRQSEERYRELFENAKDAIYVHDLGGRYVSVNRAAEELIGFSRDEILGKHFSNFVSPRDLKYVRTNLCRKLDEENETIYEVNVVNRNGLRIPVEVSSRLIYEKGVAVGVQGTARDITDRKRAQEALRIYSQRLIEAQEAERQKIARELHDEIGQVLTAVRINLQSIQRSRGADEDRRPLDESIAIVDEALGSVRELSIELRPALLDDLGLSAALRWYVDRYAQRTGITARVLNGFKEDTRLPRELETACFRIAQEALTNVARHAQASNVSVQLERSRERMLLTIIDDGIGFDINKLRKSASPAAALGLRGMEERALVLGGYIEIESGSECGTRIRATFPLRRK